MKKPLKIAIIAGEESGDLLAADLVQAMHCQYGAEIELVGVGGRHLKRAGLQSLLPMEDIAIIGLAQILKKLPLLMRHIHRCVKQIVAARPDCLIIVDARTGAGKITESARDPICRADSMGMATRTGGENAPLY